MATLTLRDAIDQSIFSFSQKHEFCVALEF